MLCYHCQAYGSFSGELYRITCKSSTKLTDFKNEIKMVVMKLKIQDFKFIELKKAFSKTGQISEFPGTTDAHKL